MSSDSTWQWLVAERHSRDLVVMQQTNAMMPRESL
jgi:hypothetical protein